MSIFDKLFRTGDYDWKIISKQVSIEEIEKEIVDKINSTKNGAVIKIEIPYILKESYDRTPPAIFTALLRNVKMDIDVFINLVESHGCELINYNHDYDYVLFRKVRE